MEDTRTVCRLIDKNFYMCTIDLKDAYYLVPIADEHKKFLRFKFENKFYEFNCLPFGLSSAPYVFTKLLKPVAHFLRSRGFMSVIYLDDILIIGEDENKCKQNMIVTRDLLEFLGFKLNLEKCCLLPKKICRFLGFIFDSEQLCVKLPKEKITKMNILINKIITTVKNKIPYKIRDLAQLCGTLASACPAVKYGWVYTKTLEREKYIALKKSNGNFNNKIILSEDLLSDLKWWSVNLESSYKPLKIKSFVKEIFTDASLTGWGAACDKSKTHGWWNSKESLEHINYLELLAVFNGLKCFAKSNYSCEILLRIDNTTAISYINRMGGVQFPKLNNLTKQIWRWCEKRNIWIFASYIKSEENKIADIESRRLMPHTEWALADIHFEVICKYFGIPSIDLFASKANHKCDRYISWFKDPDSLAVDAFTVTWSREYFYAFPPFSVILKTLNKIREDKAEGIVVVPFWPTQPWFPLYNKLLIKDPIYFYPNNNLLVSSYRIHHPLAKQLTLMAGKLSAKHIG